MKLAHLIVIAGGITALSWGSLHAIVQKISAQTDEKCIQVFHDSKKEARSVIKHLQGFPDFKQYVKNIEQYQAGDTEKCQATIYIGSKEDSDVPRAFVGDYAKTSKNVVWIGYNIWQLGDQFERIFGMRYIGFNFTKASRGSEILYKGQSYRKSILARKYVDLLAVNSKKSEVLAEIRSDNSREAVPYVVRSKNRFYYADIPAEHSKYMESASILTDVLSEIIGAPPQGKVRSISSNAL